MRWTLACLPPALALSCGSRDPAPPLRIATWNVHNLFDDEKDRDEVVVSESFYEARLTRIAGVLMELDADMVVLEEVEDQKVLSDLSARAPELRYADRILVPGNDPRGINIGVLSRVRVERFVSHRDDAFGPYGYRYARDCLEIHVTRGPVRLALLAVHFKSKAPPDDPMKRLAEAEHTRSIADALSAADPGSAILILGDFNDTPFSPPWQAVAGDDPDRYHDVAEALASPFTYDRAGHEELIDHAMSNPALVERLDRASVTIEHSSAARAASDHAPLAASFDLW